MNAVAGSAHRSTHAKMTLPRRHLAAALLLTASYVAVLWAMDFHLCLNDYWAWSFLASRANLSDPATLQNGFMPPAYLLFVKALGSSHAIAGAFALSFAAVFVSTVAVLRIAARFEVPRAAGWSAVLLGLFPPFLQSGMTAGPDVVVVALVSVAVALHWREQAPTRHSWIAGGLLGLALLVRSHALLAAAGIGLAAVLVDRSLGRREVALGTPLAIGLALQAALNLAAGRAAWATDQAFNVYKMVHGMDWYAPVDPGALSVVAVVRGAPLEFLHEWAGAIARAGAWLAAPALVLLVLRGEGHAGLRRFSAMALVAGTVYTLPVALGDSPRAAVLLSAMVIPPSAALILALRRRRGSVAGLLAAGVIAFGCVAGLRADRDFLRHNFAQARDFAAVEDLLVRAGVTRAEQVFTDDFDLYFRELDGRRPLTKGGWGLIGIDGWAEEFAQLPTGETERFLQACREHDVRYLALTRRVRRMGPQMAVLRYDPARVGATVFGECGEFLVVAVPEIPPLPAP